MIAKSSIVGVEVARDLDLANPDAFLGRCDFILVVSLEHRHFGSSIHNTLDLPRRLDYAYRCG